MTGHDYAIGNQKLLKRVQLLKKTLLRTIVRAKIIPDSQLESREYSNCIVKVITKLYLFHKLYSISTAEMESVRIFSTRPAGKFQNLRRLTGFFTDGFCSLLNPSNEKILKWGAMGEVLKFVTPDQGLRKKKRKKKLTKKKAKK